jgi:hypothetical protein
MHNRNSYDQSFYSSNQEETKDKPLNNNLSRFDLDLYKEEDDVALKAIRVKRFVMPNKEEKWKIFEDNKVLFVLDGEKLSKKEKNFLKTADGLNFLISKYKSGNLGSISSIKKEIKDATSPSKTK